MKELGTPNDYSVNLRRFLISNIRGCLSDAGETFIPVRSHPCSLLCMVVYPFT